ncbi:MAG TPA: hypothetical protein VMT23_03485 [Candidatus Binatia bacterium]|nr:hypothetical protein [Candidatus Binatia bacterium]
MKRLRLGVLLIIVSWLPFAQLFIWIAHNNQRLTTEKAASSFRLVIWGIQVVIGLVGLWLVGRLAVDAAKKDGWKHTPANLWQLFKHGQDKA